MVQAVVGLLAVVFGSQHILSLSPDFRFFLELLLGVFSLRGGNSLFAPLPPSNPDITFSYDFAFRGLFLSLLLGADFVFSCMQRICPFYSFSLLVVF